MSANQAVFPIATMAACPRRLDRRLLCLAAARAVGPGEGRRGPAEADPNGPRRLAGHLWRAPHSCRAAGRWRSGRQEAGRPADASGRPCRGQPTARRRHDRRDPDARPAPDLVDRNFAATRADQLWVADITYIPTSPASSISPSCWTPSAARSSAGRWRATCAPSSSWTPSTWRSASAGLATSSTTPIRAASTPRSPSAPLPRGRRAAIDGLGRRRLRQRHVRELLRHAGMRAPARRRFHSKAAAQMAIFEFIEGWYNPIRRHKGLGRIPPIEFERRHSMNHERAVTHRPARSVAREAPRAQPVDNRL